MQTKKEIRIKDFKALAIKQEATSQIKGGTEWRANVAIIVDWS